jgi:GNAT superfamily N-acetyltransferase
VRDNASMNRIRRAEPADSGALFDLTREFATSFHPQVETFEQSFNYLIKQDDALLLVIVEADQMSGYLLGFDHHALYANGRVSWVEEIMVRPDRRRCGLGRDLMLHFELWAAARGSRLVALATRRAALFYTAIGYHESALYFRKLL